MNLTQGIETLDRMVSTASFGLISGTLEVGFARAARTEVVTQMLLQTAGTAAVGLTLCRMGIYGATVDGSGVLLASTANDITIGAATYTEYAKALTASLMLQKGEIYGLAVLMVGTTMPSLRSSAAYAAASAVRTSNLRQPVQGTQLAGQTDLPSALVKTAVAEVWIPYIIAIP